MEMDWANLTDHGKNILPNVEYPPMRSDVTIIRGMDGAEWEACRMDFDLKSRESCPEFPQCVSMYTSMSIIGHH